MSTANTFGLANGTDITLQTFALITTNSGVDIGLVAGSNLPAGWNAANSSLNIDSGKTDTFMLIFTNSNGKVYQSNGNVANLTSGSSYIVSATLSGSDGDYQMTLLAALANDWSKSTTYGPWDIYAAPSVGMGSGTDIAAVQGVTAASAKAA